MMKKQVIGRMRRVMKSRYNLMRGLVPYKNKGSEVIVIVNPTSYIFI